MAVKKDKKIETSSTSWWPVLSVATIIFFVGAGLFSVEAVYKERIFPGVRVGDIELGNLTAADARLRLQSRFDQVEELKLVWGVNKWTSSTKAFELTYETDTVVDQALGVRSWAQRLESVRTGVVLEPVYTLSDTALKSFVASVSSEVNIPATEPQISLDPNTNVVNVSPGANGRQVDERQLWQNLSAGFSRLDTSMVVLPVVELKPQLSNEQVQATQRRSQSMVGKSLTIKGSEDGQVWTIATADLLGWVDPANAQGWKEEAIREWVLELAKTVDRQPENASFHFEKPGRVTEFKPAKNGLVVQQSELVQSILQQLGALETGQETATISLNMTTSLPAVGNGDANSLGINELLARGESWFTGSITNRIFNIQKAASVLNGVLVAPGETFSFNKAVGEISQATGYKSAFIIKEGKTLLGDGGGVCQVSSTLFRAVLNAGVPIPERTAHAYRVSYYEQNYQPGFDATIFQPAPDFKFTNDTPAHILIQTEFDEKAKKLTFSLYGTSDGRKAEVSKSRTWDVVPAPPDLYVDDPTLPVGQVRQTEHKANGAKVAFDWKVTRGEEVLQQKTFYSNYKAWQAVYLRGTKI